MQIEMMIDLYNHLQLILVKYLINQVKDHQLYLYYHLVQILYLMYKDWLIKKDFQVLNLDFYHLVKVWKNRQTNMFKMHIKGAIG